MKYVPPIGGGANDPYVDANPGAGVDGSPVPAAAIEHPMRELVAIIQAAGLAPSEANLAQVLAALRSAGVFQTPAQFDNTTKAATTAFVQRALGNYSGQSNYSVPTSLTAAHAGQLVTSTDTTITLPLASTCLPGTRIAVLCQGSAQSTIQTQGGDTLYRLDNSTGSVVVPASQLAIFRVGSTGVSWNLEEGDFGLKYAKGFASNLSGSGYQKLPSGLLVQWGTIGTGSNPVTVTFPVAFPNNVFGMHAGYFETTATPAQQYGSCGYVSLSQAKVSRFTDAGVATASNGSWLAWGN